LVLGEVEEEGVTALGVTGFVALLALEGVLRAIAGDFAVSDLAIC
jgi:hypothetical protein